MEAQRGQLHSFFTSALLENECSTSHSSFCTLEQEHQYSFRGRWVGLKPHLVVGYGQQSILPPTLFEPRAVRSFGEIPHRLRYAGRPCLVELVAVLHYFGYWDLIPYGTLFVQNLYFESDQENIRLFVKLNILCYVQENFVHGPMNLLYNIRHCCLWWRNRLGWIYEGCLTVHLPHEITWNANLMQQGNFIDVYLARHVSGTYAHHQEHQMLSCSIRFSAPSIWMGGGLDSRCVGRV